MENPSRPGPWAGWLNGLLGVVIFSGSLPATRVAVEDLSPFFLTFARASIAGGLALLLILLRRETRPTVRQAASLAVICAGVVVGFPLLTALALQHVTSAHSMVFIGLLPLATALFGVLRGGERPARHSGFSRYWAACWWRVLPSPGMCGSHYRATC